MAQPPPALSTVDPDPPPGPVGDVRSKVIYLTYRYLGEAMAHVPEPVAQLGAAVVAEGLARRAGLPRRMAVRHLEHVLGADSPEVAPDPAVVARWARRSFRSYARYWMEGSRLPRTPAAEVDQGMMIEQGAEHLHAAMAAGRGVILVLPHVGSWEWGGAWLAHIGYPMTAVAERIEPPELFDWFVDQRHAMGLTIVPLGAESSGIVLKTLREGGLVGLLCDRDLGGNGIEVDFFGERTTMPGGPAMLAMRSGAALLGACVYSGPGDQHTAVITPPLDLTRSTSLRRDVARVTQDIARAFEGFIRRAPEQWHLFQPNWASDTEGAGGAPVPPAPSLERHQVGDPAA